MTKLTSFAARLLQNEDGATAIEYGLLAALISVVCVAVWINVGTELKAAFTNVANALTNANTSSGG